MCKSKVSNSVIKIEAEAATETMLRRNSISQIDNKMKLFDEKIEKLSSNQRSAMLQQTNIRNVQASLQDEIKHIITTSQLNDLIDAKCNAIVETKLKSADVVTIEKFNQLEKKVDSMDKVQPTVYFTASSKQHFDTDGHPIPFEKIVADSNSGFVGSSGVFTVKIAGDYHFTASIMKYPSTNLDFIIYHNTKRVCRAMNNDTSEYHMLSCSGTISVKSGDTVFVELISGRIHSGDYSTFSGFKI